MANIAPNRLKDETDLGTIGAYFALLKPRVMSLAIFTALCGQILALRSSSTTHPILFLIALLSIAMGAGAAGCINMWYDRDIDRKMKRTKNRPIPAGAVKSEDFKVRRILSIISVVLLGLASNFLAKSIY